MLTTVIFIIPTVILLKLQTITKKFFFLLISTATANISSWPQLNLCCSSLTMLTTVIFIISTVIFLKLQTITKKLLCCSFPQPCLNLTSTKSLLQFTYHGPDPDIRQLRLHSQGASLANIYDPYSGKVVVSESVVQSDKKTKNQIFSTKSLVKFWSVKTSVWSMSWTELPNIVAVALLCPSSAVLHLNSINSMQLNRSIPASDSDCWETLIRS